MLHPGLLSTVSSSSSSSARIATGHVVEAGSEVRVDVDAGGVPLAARVALAVPFVPRVGDEVLVLVQDDAAYIVGVLAFAAGDAVLDYPTGGVTIRAAGVVRVESAQRVETEAPVVRTRGGRVEVEATTLWQRVTDSFAWVRGLMQRRAGRSRTIVDGAIETTAGTSTLRTTGLVKIDGSEVHLG
ncbi:MAG: DUF3540 domain-containing protein [Planctomycetota bacterium]